MSKSSKYRRTDVNTNATLQENNFNNEFAFKAVFTRRHKAKPFLEPLTN